MKMKIEIDLKSLALGALAAAVVGLGVAATNVPPTVGRYQIVISNDGKAAVVDTVTGQCWTAFVNANGQASGTIGTPSFLTPKNT